MQRRYLLMVLVGWFVVAPLGAAEGRPSVYYSVTRLADEDTKEDTWVAMGGKLPRTDGAPTSWYWYPRYGKPFFAVVTPVAVSEVAIFGVRFFWDTKDADAFPEKLMHVEAKWDTPTPFTVDGRQFVLFASLRSLQYVKEKSQPRRTTAAAQLRAAPGEMDLIRRAEEGQSWFSVRQSRGSGSSWSKGRV